MIKRFLFATACCLLLFMMPVRVSACPADRPDLDKSLLSEEVTDLGGGVTVVTTIYVSRPSHTGSRSTEEIVSADKTSTGRVNGVEVWSYTISGSFTYNGSTARASDPSDDYSIYDSDWSCAKHSVRASGASIIGSASFVSGSGARKSASPKLTCSPSGNIS